MSETISDPAAATREACGALKPAYDNLVGQLAPHIQGGEYGGVVLNGNGGQVAHAVVGRVIELAGGNEETLPQVLVAPTQEENSGMQTRMQEGLPEGRALVLSLLIGGARRASPVARALNNLERRYDLATVLATRDAENYRGLMQGLFHSMTPNDRLYIGRQDARADRSNELDLPRLAYGGEAIRDRFSWKLKVSATEQAEMKTAAEEWAEGTAFDLYRRHFASSTSSHK